MRKLLTALSLLTAAALLASCGIVSFHDGADTTTAENTAAPVTTGAETDAPRQIDIDTDSADAMKKRAEDALGSLSVINMSGARIMIACLDLTFAEGNGEQTVLSADRSQRTAKLETKFNADVAFIRFTEKELLTKLGEAVKNGEYFADVLAVPASLVGRLVSDGLVKSLRKLPDTNLKASYFSADATDAFSAGHGLYAVAGEGCFEPEKIYCVYFNRSLLDGVGADPYKLVKDGEWTLEKYAELSAAFSAAGAGAAIVKTGLDYKKALYLGSGLDFTTNGTDKTPAANTFSDGYMKTAELLKDLADAAYHADPAARFSEGETPFFIGTVADAEKLPEDAGAWGMLPMPKYGAGAEYSAYLSEDATVLCVPACNSDDRLSGDFIEAFNACSESYMKYDQLYHYMLDVLRDNGSVNCLNIILGCGNYDFVTAFASGYPNLYKNTAEAFGELISGELEAEEYMQREDEVKEYLAKWFPVTYK